MLPAVYYCSSVIMSIRTLGARRKVVAFCFLSKTFAKRGGGESHSDIDYPFLSWLTKAAHCISFFKGTSSTALFLPIRGGCSLLACILRMRIILLGFFLYLLHAHWWIEWEFCLKGFLFMHCSTRARSGCATINAKRERKEYTSVSICTANFTQWKSSQTRY